jgi:hypothetical protein
MDAERGLLEKVLELLVPLLAGVAAAMVSLAADASSLI